MNEIKQKNEQVRKEELTLLKDLLSKYFEDFSPEFTLEDIFDNIKNRIEYIDKKDEEYEQILAIFAAELESLKLNYLQGKNLLKTRDLEKIASFKFSDPLVFIIENDFN